MRGSLFHCDQQCAGAHVRKNGTTSSGGQRYRCIKCGMNATVGGARGKYMKEFKQLVIYMHTVKGDTIRSLAEKFGLSTKTIVERKKELA